MRRFVALALLFPFLTSSVQAEYKIDVSTRTILGNSRTPKTKKHPIRAASQTIHKAIQKTKPNPRVQAPAAPAMPVQAPEMPKPPEPIPEPVASGADRFFNAAAKIMTKSWRGNIFVWLPAISTDPNTGPTMGIMPVLVLADPATHHIRHLLAPSYTYNELFGQTVTGRYYFYPTDSSQLYSAASYSQHVNRELKLRYENADALDGVLFLRGETFYNKDASLRFFGIGPDTRKSDETGYTGETGVARGAIGMNFAKAWRATIGMRFQRFKTNANIIPNTTDILQRFPNVNGVGSNNTVTNEFRLLWDTRDSGVTPSKGSSGELFTEKTSRALGSDSEYFRYGLEGKRLLPWNDRNISAVRVLYEQANGANIPFNELPSLGGRTTLRGYGDGRFMDKGRLVTSVEHRIIFAKLAMMGIETNFEVAPFVDLGTVFPSPNKFQRKDVRPVFGGAFRAAVKPNVVGDVEVGVGKEGVAVFVDINYPF